MSLPKRISRQIAAHEVGASLADIAAHWLGATASELIARGGLWLNGKRIEDGHQPAPAGARMTLCLPPGGCYQDLGLSSADVLYEDDWLLALHKRAGWYSNATPWDNQGHVLAAARRWLATRDGAPPPLHLAHQLDRDTSGVLLLSKARQANPGLQQAFAGGNIKKEYCCAVWGVPAERTFSMCSGHGRAAGGRWRLYELSELNQVLPGGGRVRRAETRFVLRRSFGDAAILAAYPGTGRTHQIRLHLAAAGHPILGDTRYGGPAHYRGNDLSQHLLHAYRLALTHPITGAELSLVAPVPEWHDLGIAVSGGDCRHD
jgi:23S rRNA pseudouridine1911/1915/1917 synthase